ncbi:hypothetical protein Bbelb_158230 [Branchiostoma belcheri]|nr:hypothetical protein Bbelb_158230 [Branchiostoma belcheri]
MVVTNIPGIPVIPQRPTSFHLSTLTEQRSSQSQETSQNAICSNLAPTALNGPLKQWEDIPPHSKSLVRACIPHKKMPGPYQAGSHTLSMGRVYHIASCD